MYINSIFLPYHLKIWLKISGFQKRHSHTFSLYCMPHWIFRICNLTFIKQQLIYISLTFDCSIGEKFIQQWNWKQCTMSLSYCMSFILIKVISLFNLVHLVIAVISLYPFGNYTLQNNVWNIEVCCTINLYNFV